MKDPEIDAIRRAMLDDAKLDAPLRMLMGLVTAGRKAQSGFSGLYPAPDIQRISEGFPLADIRILPDDLEKIREHFAQCVAVILHRDPDAAARTARFYEDRVLFRELLSGVLMQEYQFPESFRESSPVVLLAANETLYWLLAPLGKDAQKHDLFKQWTASYCPVCGAYPHLSLIEENEARLSLSCSRCFARYTFRRITCPFCGEAQQKKLRYFTAEGDDIHRVYVCESCKHYIKSADLGKKPVVFPRLEDLLTIRLDIIAGRQGYIRETIDLVSILVIEE